MTMTPRIAILASLLTVTWGCGSNGSDTGGSLAAAQSAEAVAPGDAAAPALTDPQIAHVAVTANAIDVELARLADARTNTAAVRGFANTMITTHTAVNEQAAALAQRLGVTPEDNDVSRSLQEGAAAARGALEPLNGEAFDRAYIDREVGYHQAVLDALDQTLIPATSNEELRGLLQQVRPAIAAHLEHARALHGSLGASR